MNRPNFWLNYKLSYEKTHNLAWVAPTRIGVWKKKLEIDFTCKSIFDSNVVDILGFCLHLIFTMRMYFYKKKRSNNVKHTMKSDLWETVNAIFFGHHKNYANEITCKLSAQHATVNVYKNEILNWIIWKDTKTLPATFISSVKLKPEYLLKQMFI